MLGLEVSNVIEPRKLVSAPPEASVADATRLMASHAVGAVLVVEDERLVGIFTERDAVYRVMAAALDPARTSLRDVMTPDPKVVAPEDSFGYALLLMHENGFRHAPVVANGVPVGVVSARHAMDPDLEEFAVESNRRRLMKRRSFTDRAKQDS